MVAQARAVPQQMHGRDARIQAAIRQVSGGAVVQIELAMLREQQDRGGRVALAQGSDAKAGVRGVLRPPARFAWPQACSATAAPSA